MTDNERLRELERDVARISENAALAKQIADAHEGDIRSFGPALKEINDAKVAQERLQGRLDREQDAREQLRQEVVSLRATLEKTTDALNATLQKVETRCETVVDGLRGELSSKNTALTVAKWAFSGTALVGLLGLAGVIISGHAPL